ncbi:MAG TPA: ATP-binding protein [Terriglobia bacterium]|nr:ATP-binding protein [Terriglobia bacterium]
MAERARTRKRRLTYESRILLLALAAGAPGILVAGVLLWRGDYSAKVQWTLLVLVGCFWLGFAFAARGRVVLPLQTLSNLLSAVREGDYSLRARGARRDDSLGEVMLEANALAGELHDRRLGALEATTLLRKVMEEIEVAVFAFDAGAHLRLVNRAAERLLAQPAERLLGSTAAECGLAECLKGEAKRTLQTTFPGGPDRSTRWGMSRSTFREGGIPLELVVIGDLSRPLREEELKAWQRLVRVIGHELNNSLAPIKSVAASLESMLVREPRPADWQDDVAHGLRIIASRAESLGRFMEAYSRLARLPKPQFRAVDVDECVRRVIALETRLRVTLVPGPRLTVRADGDQLEQLLINAIRNAVDAALETGGGVSVGWRRNPATLDLWVEDEGPGLPNTGNLFVPFFTTKPQGSGIGLVLSRQIAEAHGGTFTLENRAGGTGCVASLRLPLPERAIGR